MPTIIEVAAMAGVSTATVSRVLSRPDQVSEKTRLRVLAIVRSSGYAPNVAARSLRTLRAAKILLTVPDISNPFFASVIRGAEEAARVAEITEGVQRKFEQGGTWQNRWPTNVDVYEEEWQRFKAA